MMLGLGLGLLRGANSRVIRCPHRAEQRRSFFAWIKNDDNVVKNTGSIARDVLACERTFLAWSRTGLGFVGAGSAMFAAYHRYDEGLPKEEIYPASALLVGNGVFLLLFATRRYLRMVSLLTQDKFPIDTRGTLLSILVTATSTVASLGLVLNAEYQKAEKDKPTSNQPGESSKRTE
jgi:uncharacterized membrane protein YidH (DUF202 family)